MRNNASSHLTHPQLGLGLILGVAIVLGSPTRAAATGLALPPEPFLDVYIHAAEESECGVDWAVLGGIAGVASNHTIPTESDTQAQPASDTVVTIPIGFTPNPPSVKQTSAAEEASDSPIPVIDDASIAAAIADAFPLPPETPEVYGRVLDGEEGVHLINDTDGGLIDHETVWDRAVGPFQFIPSTWEQYGTDGNGDGVADPQNLQDAAASAARLLCDNEVVTDPVNAVTVYYGTDIYNDRVFEHAAELRSYWQSLQPPPPTPAADQVQPAAGNVSVERVDGIVVASRIAEQTRNMIAAAKADGVELTGWGWRSHERQIELRAAHCADVWLTPSSQCSPPTATPGNSMHEIGEAIDFFTGDSRRTITASDPEFVWLTAHAAEYGFFNLPSETWHWSTNGH